MTFNLRKPGSWCVLAWCAFSAGGSYSQGQPEEIADLAPVAVLAALLTREEKG